MGTEHDSSQMRGEESRDKNRQRELFSPTNLNGSGSSQPAGTHEILFDCCNPSHLLTHRDVCESMCVFGYTVGTWPPVTTVTERREHSYLVEYFYLSVHQHLQMLMKVGFGCHISLIDFHSVLFIKVLKEREHKI